MSQNTTPKSEKVNNQLNELFKRFDNLSEKGQTFVSNFFDALIEKATELENARDLTRPPNKRNPYFKDNELERIPYTVEFYARHGAGSELEDKDKLELIVHDAIFKAESLFSLVSLVGNVCIAGHHKFDSELLMNALDEVGQIGFSLISSLHKPIEDLASMPESSEARND